MAERKRTGGGDSTEKREREIKKKEKIEETNGLSKRILVVVCMLHECKVIAHLSAMNASLRAYKHSHSHSDSDSRWLRSHNVTAHGACKRSHAHGVPCRLTYHSEEQNRTAQCTLQHIPSGNKHDGWNHRPFALVCLHWQIIIMIR